MMLLVLTWCSGVYIVSWSAEMDLVLAVGLESVEVRNTFVEKQGSVMALRDYQRFVNGDFVFHSDNNNKTTICKAP